MGQKEKDIRENPKFNRKIGKVEDSKNSTPNDLPSKYGDHSVDNKNNESNNISGLDDLNNTSMNSSANVSQLNKTARVQHHMSILQRNFAKIGPIFRQLVSFLVKEGDDTDDTDNEEENDDSKGNKEVTIESETQQGNKIDMRNMLGFLNQNLYHDYLNITNIMKLKRLDFRDVYGLRNPDLVLTRENLMERVMLLITSYFCMGTELRFLKQMLVEGFEDSIDSEFWHGKALQLAIKFLPSDAPLVKHIVSSYQKHHSPSFEQIPEDQEIISEVKIIRPNEGITSNKLAP